MQTFEALCLIFATTLGLGGFLAAADEQPASGEMQALTVPLALLSGLETGPRYFHSGTSMDLLALAVELIIFFACLPAFWNLIQYHPFPRPPH